MNDCPVPNPEAAARHAPPALDGLARGGPTRRAAAAVVMAALAGCTLPPAPAPGGSPGGAGGPASSGPSPGPGSSPTPIAEPLVIRGELAYRARIALPPDAVAVVELRARADAPPLAQQRIPLAGRQLPVAFELTADRRQVRGDGSAVLQGAVLVGVEALWETEPLSIPPVPGPIELGRLWMRQVQASLSLAPR